MVDFSYGIITVSDTCHKGEAIDKSGPAIKVLLQNYFNAFKLTQSTVPDEVEEIVKMLLYYSDVLKLDCIITTGGTGYAQRDVTPEATRKVIEREAPQLAVLMFFEGLRHTRFAALSRGVCGIRGRTLILNFPGSAKACTECFEAVRELLPHAMQLISDAKEQVKEEHMRIQTDAGPPEYNDVIRGESAEKVGIVRVGIEKEEEKNEPVPSPIKAAIESSVEQFKAAKVVEAPKMKDFSQLLQQSASSMDDAIFSGLSPPSVQQKGAIPKVFDAKPSPVAARPVEAPSAAVERSLMDDLTPLYQAQLPKHVCPHKTADPGDESDRNSPYPMIEVSKALDMIFENIKQNVESVTFKSPMNCPPFRASLKDGYALKSSSSSRSLKVIGSISAGDAIITSNFESSECYKINTGAPLPDHADCIIQVEDTKLLSSSSTGLELEIMLLKSPSKNRDIRPVGADLKTNEILFTTSGILDVAQKTFLASVGLSHVQKLPKIAIISTGDELVDPSSGELPEGKIYDTNTTMLRLLCQKFGFDVKFTRIARDDRESLKTVVQAAMQECRIVVTSGGVSMGDKDFIKSLLVELGYRIHFGRVNVKPGKPMTFATHENGTAFFGLPGNPVSAFVCFHVFVLPALRFVSGFSKAKSMLPTIFVILKDSKYELDERPEYARATLNYDNNSGLYYAQITSKQDSSRVASLINADVLLHLPPRPEVANGVIGKGRKLKASIIDQFCVSGMVE